MYFRYYYNIEKLRINILLYVPENGGGRAIER